MRETSKHARPFTGGIVPGCKELSKDVIRFTRAMPIMGNDKFDQTKLCIEGEDFVLAEFETNVRGPRRASLNMLQAAPI